MTDINRATATRNLDAYYYGFDPTGCDLVDSVLEQVARAGKAFHSTDYWNEEDLDGLSPVDKMQAAANASAKTIMALIAEVEHLRKDAARYRWLRRKACIIATNDGAEFRMVNLPGATYIAPAPEIELDAAIDAALEGATQ
ncbi:TPA: hypothetical protein L4V19_002006 [Pseudomonas aeruginosa]|nr:hypothetical protein [Pseudomonas aeruginosa]